MERDREVLEALLKLYFSVVAEGKHGPGREPDEHFACPICHALTVAFVALRMKEDRGRMWPADFTHEEAHDILIDLMTGVDPRKDYKAN